MLQLNSKFGVCEESHQGIQSGTLNVWRKIPSLLRLFPKAVCEFKHGNKYNLFTMTELRCDFWAISFKRVLLLVRVKFYITFISCNRN